MKAFDEFKNKPTNFWASVKFVSEQLGYSSSGTINQYSENEIESLFKKRHLYHYARLITELKQYTDMRADLLNGFVKENLMTGEEAKEAFENIYPIYESGNFKCDLPLNKQKGDMKQIAYFTAIINILAEKTIREIAGNVDEILHALDAVLYSFIASYIVIYFMMKWLQKWTYLPFVIYRVVIGILILSLA